MNLLEKLAKIRQMTQVIQKNKQAYGYKYVTESEILERVTAGMKQYNVSLIPSIVGGTLKTDKHEYKNAKGKDVCDIVVTADMQYKWIDNENPDDFIISDWVLIGEQSDSSMALGSALSYTNRYFMLKYFQIATVEDDPDNWRTRQQEHEKAEEFEELQNLRKEILDTMKAKIASGVERAKVVAILKENNDGQDHPNKIATSELAKSILEKVKSL